MVNDRRQSAVLTMNNFVISDVTLEHRDDDKLLMINHRQKYVCVGVGARIPPVGSDVPSRPAVTRFAGEPRLQSAGGQRIIVGHRLCLHYCTIHARAPECRHVGRILSHGQ